MTPEDARIQAVRAALAELREKNEQKGLRWADGSAVRESDIALFFLGTQFFGQLERGAGISLEYVRDPIHLLTGGDWRQAHEQVNRSPIGQRWKRQRGESLGRADYWEEVIIGPDNPTGVAFAYSKDRDEYAGAAVIESSWTHLITFTPNFNVAFEVLRQSTRPD